MYALVFSGLLTLAAGVLSADLLKSPSPRLLPILDLMSALVKFFLGAIGARASSHTCGRTRLYFVLAARPSRAGGKSLLLYRVGPDMPCLIAADEPNS